MVEEEIRRNDIVCFAFAQTCEHFIDENPCMPAERFKSAQRFSRNEPLLVEQSNLNATPPRHPRHAQCERSISCPEIEDLRGSGQSAHASRHDSVVPHDAI